MIRRRLALATIFLTMSGLGLIGPMAASGLASPAREVTRVPSPVPAPVTRARLPQPPSLAGGVHVVGNRLVDSAGDPVQLVGVNRSGSEYACVQGWGIFDGPVDGASIAAIASWHSQVVRIPLNEDCWLGINGVSQQYGGAAYRKAIKGFVHRIEAHGMLVDLDLHWNAPGTVLAEGQQVMADADHSPTFWKSVAQTFKADPDVLFEMYNEPHDVSWACWLHGCTTSDGWQTAGMQSLVSAVRSTGATNVILVGGLGWSSDLSRWLAHEPTDPMGQLAATFHTYDFSGCNTQGLDGRQGGEAGPCRHDRVRRDRLRRQLCDVVHELGGPARRLVPGVDLGHLGLRQRPGAHHLLRRNSDRLRPGSSAALRRPLRATEGQ
jgi:endoglucanase